MTNTASTTKAPNAYPVELLDPSTCTAICPAHVARRFVAEGGAAEYRRRNGISQGTPARDSSDKHEGELAALVAKDPNYFDGSLGRNTADKVVQLAQAEKGHGPLCKDLVKDERRRDELRRRVSALLDTVCQHGASVTRAYDDAQRAREGYLTPEALAVLMAEREAKAREKALTPAAEFKLALERVAEHPGPEDDEADEALLALQTAIFAGLDRIVRYVIEEQERSFSLTHARLRARGQLLVDLGGSPSPQGNSSPNGGGTLGLPAETGEAS